MNKEIMKAAGFEKEVIKFENLICPMCDSKKTNPNDFRDDLSRKEFMISGLCQECQDKVFGAQSSN